MPHYFTTYWDNHSAKHTLENGRDEPLDHTAGNHLDPKTVRSGDVVYVVTVRDGTIRLIGRMVVDRIVGQREAERLLKDRLYTARHHVIAAKGQSSQIRDREIPGRIVRQLRFETAQGTTKVTFKDRGQVARQAMRKPRRLTAESASILDEFIANEDQKQAEKQPHITKPASQYFIDTPPRRPQSSLAKLSAKAVERSSDYESLDSENRKLGRAGEEWVVHLERKRLTEVGRPDLAKRVLWVSRDRGDGAGYDIESFDHKGTKIFIEVKTTNLGTGHPFFVTANEVVVSKLKGSNYWLYRVIHFHSSERRSVVARAGALSDTCELKPATFVAVFA